MGLPGTKTSNFTVLTRGWAGVERQVWAWYICIFVNGVDLGPGEGSGADIFKNSWILGSGFEFVD